MNNIEQPTPSPNPTTPKPKLEARRQSEAQAHGVHLVQQLGLRHAAGVGLLRLGAVALEGLRGGELGHVTAIVLVYCKEGAEWCGKRW